MEFILNEIKESKDDALKESYISFRRTYLNANNNLTDYLARTIMMSIQKELKIRNLEIPKN